MCGLFGFYSYGNNTYNLSKLTNSLACESAIRGTDATGIAFNQNDKLIIHKEPKSAIKMDFKLPKDTVCMMGHTRHSTQGDKKRNYNNHPFMGRCQNNHFALAHNGVLINEEEVKSKFNLPKTQIETDSYIAVQLLQKENKLNVKNIKNMAENVDGSFAFSILDDKNILWLVKGDSPLSIILFPGSKIYVYASTDSILYKALADTDLLKELKAGKGEEIKIKSGEILKFQTDGSVIRDEFNYIDFSFCKRAYWWDYGFGFNNLKHKENCEDEYLKEIKSVASYFGYTEDDIDKLLNEGFTPEDIEEFIYCYE